MLEKVIASVVSRRIERRAIDPLRAVDGAIVNACADRDGMRAMV